MFLTPEILTLSILNFIFLFFGMITFYLSLKIFFNWNISATTMKQYQLEKQSYLASVIIKYLFLIKIPMIIFFIFTLDKLSNIITGAMCAAGIINATEYGPYLIILKILNLYLFGFWLILHYKDISNSKLPYTQQKFGLFIIVFFFFILEIVLEYLMFNAINIEQIVSCCGTLYSNVSESYISIIFQVNPQIIIGLFYINFLFLVVLYRFKQYELFALCNLFYIVLSLVSLILFFGTYIYQLPTHHCPFCFLQKEYYHVGYLIYSLLFIGTFFGLLVGYKNKNKKFMTISLYFNCLYLLLVSSYPIIFYIKNGVWL